MSEVIDLKRRNFLKTSAAVGAGVSMGATSAFALSPYEDAINLKEEKIKEIKNAKFTPTFCGMCVNMCGFIAREVKGKIVKLDPNPLYTKSRSFACARGNSAIAAIYDPNRLQTPLIRVGEKGSGKFKKATWEEAYEYIKEKLVKILDEEKDNRSTIAFGAGAGAEEPIFANLVNGIGSPNFVDHFTTCFAPAFLANKLTYGSWGFGDFEKTKYALLLGANRAEAIVTPDTLDMFRNTHKRGMKLVYIDVRYTNTAVNADEFIPIKPGTDLALILAMIHETINRGYHKTPYKSEYLSKYADGLTELEEYFTKGEGAKYTPEWASKITEIPADTIRKITKEFSDAAEKYKGAAVCYRSRKSTWYYQDFDFRRAQAIFNSLHGCVNRPGGVLLGRGLKAEKYEYEDFPIYDNAKPRIDLALKPKDEYPLMNPQKGSWQYFRDKVIEINTKWKKGEKLSENEYPVRGLFVYRENPVQSVPGREKTIEMLKLMDLVVVIDIIPNDTAFFADVILPDTTFLERTSPLKSFGTLREPMIGIRWQATKPLYNSKPLRDIMYELSKKIEKDLAAITFKYTWDEDELEVPYPKGFNLAKYLNDDFEIDEEKLKKDIKDEKVIKAILTHAGEDDLDIASFKLSVAFEKTVEEFNKEVMKELYGEEALKIVKEHGVYWPGIEDAIKAGFIDEKLKVFKKDIKDKHKLIYEIYKKYSKIDKNYCIVPKNGKFIKLTLKNIANQTITSPINGKKDKVEALPKWREDLYEEPKNGEVRLVIGRHGYFTQSSHPNNFLLLDLMNYNYIWINDELAKELNLKFKDEVELTNREGKKVRGKVYPTKKIRKDTIFVATGFGSQSKLLTLGYDNGISQAAIAEDHIDPFIGAASMNETFVKIRKV
ncbi:molybdopterin-dependent oxidoreductase [Caminibacter mediatlanticus]|uniref:Thiosulfate reductase n=1 Tax=Caminibacter mediatlanticus TB-2 TaxID=391592 RepID=A0AAI9AI11_9BACT|nr:molybdopterin-dependent oxidoreductase [Caminibacter mediatlanticus]EDM24581.1 thiosulfate reductase [Caminibacter mediatlanticus TB-2]